MLVLEHLSFRHAGGTTLYDFTLEARPGEITAISGPSGSGKSTLFDLIAGFLRPEGGSLAFLGKDLVPLPPESRPVSILLQDEPLFVHLSVAANLRLALPGRSRAAANGDIARALAEVGLAGLGARRASTLSGGEQQRAALARTLLLNRPVLLLDEPFSALDDETRIGIRKLVAELTRARGWTTVLISHHADDAAAIAARRYRLEAGRLVPG